MPSNPSMADSALEGLDLNSDAMAADYIAGVAAEPVPCPPENSGRAAQSAAETLTEIPEGSFDLGEGGEQKPVTDPGDRPDSLKRDLVVEAEIDSDPIKKIVIKSLEQDEKQTVLPQVKDSIGLGSSAPVVEEIPVMRDSVAVVKFDAGDDGDQKEEAGEQENVERAEKQSEKRATGRPSTDSVENDQRAHDYLPLQEGKTGFSVTDLVWGKVRSHPWWPGQIFDPLDASEMALKLQKKDHFLVAYFGDKTFAWCEESRLKHFELYFSQMEKQSSMDAFVNAVNAALGEVSMREELGMTCYCLADESYSDIMYEEVENAGLREGACRSSVDRSLIANSFQPNRLLEYIRALAQCSLEGADRLELVTAKAQLKGFYHSKGYPELPIFLIGGGLIENDAEISPSKSKKSGEDVNNSNSIPSDMISGKGKSRGRPRSKPKNIMEDGRKHKSLSEVMEEKDVQHLANGRRNGSGGKATSRSSGRKHKVADSDSTELGKSKKKRLDSLGDLQANSRSPTLNKSLKVGDRIRHVASQLKGSPLVLKCNGDTLQNSVAKASRRRGGGVGINDSSRTHQDTSASKEYYSSNEMLSQLCLAARDPIKGYSFVSMIVSFFTDFRESLTSNSSKDEKHVESVGSRRGRKKMANSESASLEMSTPYFMQDSYWSDIILHSSLEQEPVSRGQKRKGKSQEERQKKKKKPAGEPSLSPPLDPTLDTSQDFLVGSISPNTKQDLEGERSIGNSVEKIMEEATPTALILSFTEPDALPSEADLIRTFSHYGPLKEAETEVLRKTNHAKVVFINRADAEVAFSILEKYSIFGPALVSYRLRCLQSSLKSSPDNSPQDKKDASPTEVDNSELPAQEDSRGVSDNMQGAAMDN